MRRPYIWKFALKYSTSPVMVRAMTSGLSVGIFAFATFDNASRMPFENPCMRTETRMVSPVTPALVSPPLPPENEMHGGEYGSPGTCSVRSAQRSTVVGPAAPSPSVPALRLVLPAAPLAAREAAAALSASDNSVVPATRVSAPLVAPFAPAPEAELESSIDSTRTSRCWLGTSTAIARKTAANPTRGP